MKTSRTRKGSTMALVAGCMFLIITLGVGIFFIAKLMAGGREIANATDAGTLNLAKNALVHPAVQLPRPINGMVTPFSEFSGCAYPLPASGGAAAIDLLTYNRCVGQALLIALNAKAEQDAGASGAMAKASLVLDDLKQIGKTLSNGLDPGLSAGNGQIALADGARPGSVHSNFVSGANKNNVNLFSNSPVAGSQYMTAFMKSGSAANVYLSSTVIPADSDPSFPTENGTFTPNTKLGAHATSSPDPLNKYKIPGKYYLQGYAPIQVTSGGITLTFYGVPVFPQVKPHLVSLADFSASRNNPDSSGSTPPNSFRVDSAAALAKTDHLGNAVACAIVGVATGAGTGLPNAVSPDFPVAIPSGYLELSNPRGNALPASYLPFDNAQNIFNNELYDGPAGGLSGAFGSGDLFVDTKGTIVFGDGAEIKKWALYNVAPSYKKPSLDPRNSGYVVPSSKIFDVNGNPATLPTLLSILPAPMADCTHENNTNTGLKGACLNLLPSMNNAYGHGLPAAGAGGESGTGGGGVSAVDTIKGTVISNFNGGGYHPKIDIRVANNEIYGGLATGMSATTGLGEYMGKEGALDVYPTPSRLNANVTKFPIQNTGEPLPSGDHPSILGLMAQVDSGIGIHASRTGSYNFTHLSPIFNDIVQRCREIQPSITASDVEKLLNAPLETAGGGFQYGLHMNETAYIYLRNADLYDTSGPTGKGLHITVDSRKVPFYSAVTPDGLTISRDSSLWSGDPLGYSLVNGGKGLVDVKIGTSPYAIKGDDNLHDQPYKSIRGEFYAKDIANWTPSSGYGNLLGRLDFANTVSGAANFSQPN